MLSSERQQFYFKIKSVWFLSVSRGELREIFWLQITSLIKSHLLIQLTTVYTGLYFIAAEIYQDDERREGIKPVGVAILAEIDRGAPSCRQPSLSVGFLIG